jgi:hypothetical protein
MGIFGETSKFYTNKVKEEWSLLIRNTIIFSIVTIITFFFSFVIGLILLLFNVLIFRSLYNNMNNTLEKIKTRYYPNGQLKWDIRQSGVKFFGNSNYQKKVNEWYENGKLKCTYRFQNPFRKESEITLIESFDKEGIKTDFNINDSIYYKFYFGL